jgi:hypothetical protein
MTTVSHQFSKSLLIYGIQWDTHDPSATQDHTGPLANSKAFGRADTPPKNPDTQIEMSNYLSGDYVNHRDADYYQQSPKPFGEETIIDRSRATI